MFTISVLLCTPKPIFYFLRKYHFIFDIQYTERFYFTFLLKTFSLLLYLFVNHIQKQLNKQKNVSFVSIETRQAEITKT